MYEDPDTGLKELVLFHAVSQGWLNETVRVLRVPGPVDLVKLPIAATPDSPAIVETVELGDQIEHVTVSGLHRIIKLGFGEKTNSIVFSVGGAFSLAPAPKHSTND